MYETIHAIALSLPAQQTVVGALGSAIAVKLLGRMTAGKVTRWTPPLNLLYLVAILSLLFFVYAIGLYLRPE